MSGVDCGVAWWWKNSLILLGTCVVTVAIPIYRGIVIECTSRWSVYLYIHKGRNPLSLLWLSDLTEIGSPMISRVNSDVTLGLTNDQWSTPM